MTVCFGMKRVLAEFNNSFFFKNKILILCILYLPKILLFVHIYNNSQISEHIHISDINKLSNIDLIKIIQKVGGINDTLSPTFQKVEGTCPPVPPPQRRPCSALFNFKCGS